MATGSITQDRFSDLTQKFIICLHPQDALKLHRFGLTVGICGLFTLTPIIVNR